MTKNNGAQLLIKCLEAQGVEYVFGIPGAKIDAVFDALCDSSIRLIVCRHEQNAAFMAGAYGRLTGKPGVVLVTSGPGVGNLVTGLLTATSEGDPIIAIGGNNNSAALLKKTHQGLNNVALMRPVTKFTAEIHHIDNIPELVSNAFRIACEPIRGACFISFPQDIQTQKTNTTPIRVIERPTYGPASQELLEKAAKLLNTAKKPLILLGLEASRVKNTEAIRHLLKKTKMAVIGTYQAAGVIPHEDLDCFGGRVGLFRNQPADFILAGADVVLTVGFNPIEYNSETWNPEQNKKIIHLDYLPCDIDITYQPVCELLGDIEASLYQLSKYLEKRDKPLGQKEIEESRQHLLSGLESGKNYKKSPIHPLRFMYELKKVMDDNTTVCCDIGTVYMWISKYFFSHRPHQLLFSNGQQTLGVGLPWAMAAKLAQPEKTVISISGDGGFLFSAMELETAVREKIKLIHFIWQDGTYNMVEEQEMMKYHRPSGTQFGAINIVEFASSFGAVGFNLDNPDDFQKVYQQALMQSKPVLINVPIDYSENAQLFHTIDVQGDSII